MKTYSLYVGADIGSDHVQIGWYDPESGQAVTLKIDQNTAGYMRLMKRLRQQAAAPDMLVVMEATGNYWMALAHRLHQAGLAVSVINPAQARYFAKAQLQLAKTDKIDALLLATFGQRMQPELWTPPPPICDQLRTRLTQHDDLVKIRTGQRNRRHALQRDPHVDASLLDRLGAHIAFLNDEIKTLRKEIKALLLGDHAWRDAADRLLTIPGIGLYTAAWILVATHAFARCHHPDQGAAFAGLAPLSRDSGSSIRGRRTVGKRGHAALRRALYMAALTATRHNPALAAFYQRLLDRRKPNKLALCAVARKLLHIAWAMVVKQRDFDPFWHAHHPIAA